MITTTERIFIKKACQDKEPHLYIASQEVRMRVKIDICSLWWWSASESLQSLCQVLFFFLLLFFWLWTHSLKGRGGGREREREGERERGREREKEREEGWERKRERVWKWCSRRWINDVTQRLLQVDLPQPHLDQAELISLVPAGLVDLCKYSTKFTILSTSCNCQEQCLVPYDYEPSTDWDIRREAKKLDNAMKALKRCMLGSLYVYFRSSITAHACLHTW